MTYTLLDGKTVSESHLDLLTKQLETLTEKTGRRPGLAVVLVGENPASKTYVNSKKKACERIGIHSFETLFDSDVAEADLLSHIDMLNEKPAVNGILVQLPLPAHIDEHKVLMRISADKDVDGFHPLSMGNLLIGTPTFIPCTPYGILKLIDYYKLETVGKHVVVVGRSNIVGKPIAALLAQAPYHCTVTMSHSRSRDLPGLVRQADIVVAAVGKPRFITSDMVKEGAVVIDVGINRIEEDGSFKIVGDVDFESVSEKVSAITPVPGGVGKMTIAMLMQNTVDSFLRTLDA